MTKEKMIQAWKNPELRTNATVHPSGISFGELTEEEMMSVQGAGDVTPETTPITLSSTICHAGFTVGVTVAVSYATC